MEGNQLVEVNIPKTKEQLIGNSSATGQTFKAADKQLYSVYESVNGKLFIIRTSKTGSFYKQYLSEAK